MLIEKCINESNEKQEPLSYNYENASNPYGVSNDLYHSKFDINAIISPMMNSYSTSAKKGFHSNPQSPLVPALSPIKLESRMHIGEQGNPGNMKTHPMYTQFKKEIFEDSINEFQNANFQQYYPPKSGMELQMEYKQMLNPDEKFFGRLKFFDEMQNYGFFILDVDNSDLFVHFEDLKKAGLTKEFLKTLKGSSYVRFSFNCVSYFGKYSLSKKAVNIQYFYDDQKPNYTYMQ